MWFSYLRIATLFVVVVANTTDSNPSSTTAFTTKGNVAQTTQLSSTTVTTAKPKPKNFNSFPYVVSIGSNVNGYYMHLCVGVIIAPQYLLSAAHCVQPKKPIIGRLYVFGGADKLNGKVQQRFVVAGIVAHPKFKVLGGYDIAVLKVSKKFPLSDGRFKSISFNQKAPSVGSEASLVGWGRVSISQVKMLQQVPFRTIDNMKCKRRHRFVYLTSSDICAMHLKGPIGACDGDSGAPLVNVEREELYGLLSYGKKACQPLKPYAFTRVSMVSDWIKRSMHSLRNSNIRFDNSIWN